MNTSATYPADCDQAVVKMVLSGDSISLKHRDGSETNVTLAFLSASRLASAKKNTNDEPYAFEAREVLRRVLIGKDVHVRVEYTTPQSNRQFCSVYVRSPKTGDWVNVCIIALQMGFVKLREDAHNRPNLPVEFSSFIEAQRRAKENKVGFWSNATPPVIETIHTLPDPAAFVKQHKGTPIKAILEHIRDGATARARLILENQPNKHYMVWIQISGIRAPSLRADAPPEPYAEEARDYFETRLLQREVELLLEDIPSGTNTMGTILATIRHPAGNIAHFLVREGLAKVHDWTIACVTDGAGPLRAAELIAKKQGLRIWAGHIDNNVNNDTKRFMALIIRILSPEMILIKSLAPATLNKEYKITLSSIRGPKREGDQEGWHHAAREYLRKIAIGKQATVTIDYERPSQDSYEARTYATVLVPSAPGSATIKDLAQDLVINGYAYVSRPRRGEENNKSTNIDELVISEAEATESKRGLHSGKPAPALPRYNDVSETPAKAKQFLPFLQRAKRVRATVEHVVNGSRLRVIVPKESAKMTLVVSGVRVPSRGEQGADEAMMATTEWAMQRDIEFEVDAVDKTGAFICTIWVPYGIEGNKHRSLGVLLLENGRAYLHDYSADQSSYSTQLYEADSRAKGNKVGLWSNYDEEEEARKLEKEKEQNLEQQRITSLETNNHNNNNNNDIKKQLMHVCISEYLSGNHFYLQKMSAEAVNNLESLMSKFSAYHASTIGSTQTITKSLKVGDLVSAKFTVDNQWYRARVRKLNKNGKEVHVFYIDYGNSEIISIDRIRNLPKEFMSLTPQAQEAKLSYIKCRQLEQDYGQDALDCLRELTEGKKLIANLDKYYNGVVWVSLFDPQTARQTSDSPIGLDFSTSINIDLIIDGYAILDKSINNNNNNNNNDHSSSLVSGPRPPNDFARIINDAVTDARNNHRGMWEYGDVDEESL